MGRRLNISQPTVIQTELSPLNDSFYLETDGQTEQWFYDNTNDYAPNRQITPLTITPRITAVDKETGTSYTPSFMTPIKWFVTQWNGTAWVKTEVVNTGSGNYDFSKVGNTLLVRKNVESPAYGITILCEAKYIDPRDIGRTYSVSDSITLTVNKDASVISPTIDILTESSLAYNPLKDNSSEFSFPASANWNGIAGKEDELNDYRVDVLGTENILPSNEESLSTCVPSLDIRYGLGEGSILQQNQSFLSRKTGGTLSSLPSDAAYLEAVKGNTVAWNQLAVNNTTNRYYTFTNGSNIVVSDTPSNFNGMGFLLTQQRIVGHKYYGKITSDVTNGYFRLFNYYTVSSPINTIRSNSGAKIFTETNNYYAVLGYSGISNGTYKLNVQLIDLTLIYGAGNEPTTPEQFEADYLSWFGKPLSYEPYDAGSLIPVRMNGIKTTGFNQWDEEWVNGYVVKETGNVRENTSTTIASKNLIPVVSNATYYFKGGGYITLYDANQAVVGQVRKNNDTFDVGTNVRYIRFHIDDYGRTYNHDICVNISNQSKNGTYESYEEHLASVPITSAKGRLLDSNGNVVGNSVFVFPDGLKKADTVYDEIKVVNGVKKAIKRVGSVDLGTLDWNYSNSYFMSSTISGIRFETPKAICPKYNNFNYDSSRFIAIGDNFAVIKDSSYTDAATLKTSLNGVMLYYELAEPQEYILDDFTDGQLFEWYGVSNGSEVKMDTLPCYISGQHTDTLTIDALYGEDITVILRVKKHSWDTTLLPPKVYRSLSWRIPRIDTVVVCKNGSAVREGTTGNYIFDTIVNANGEVVSDTKKSANLRFKWKLRKSNYNSVSNPEVDLGWGDTMSVSASTLRNAKTGDEVPSSLIYNETYLLGAYEPVERDGQIVYERTIS